MNVMREEFTIDDIGYGPFFEAGRRQLGLDGFPVARVVSESRGVYRVKNAAGEYMARVTGKQMFAALSREDYPAVGDWVAIEDLGQDQAVIRGILPRRTVIKRISGDKNRAGKKSEVQVIAANIDAALVVESVDRDYNLNRFERYFAIARDGGVRPTIVLNKTDLLSDEELKEKISELTSRFPGVGIVPTSTVSDAGLDALRRYIVKGKTYGFLGSSGVGKSSLINELIGGSVIKTGDISSSSGRGKHITTMRQMYFLKSGGIVIDNPGMREVGMAESVRGVDAIFDEIKALAKNCRYDDCAHNREPGCAVVRAVRSGALDEEKYLNYLNLKKESEYADMDDFEKREKDRQFGKFIKRAKKELKNIGRKN
ncbi:MAG: ribosome small subunit-dependent GTPase A [Patescibacteria group bacterium]|nr:ribosome small subunit-dependent GTPase A [Patescibacteria group bacterium]